MYRRYAPKQNPQNNNGRGQPKRLQPEYNVNDQIGRPQFSKNARGSEKSPQSEQGKEPPRGYTAEKGQVPEENKKGRKRLKISNNPIFSLIPPAVYNPESKKIFGVLDAEDLLLVALIFILLENEENDDPMLVYALLFILLSDYIDLPF